MGKFFLVIFTILIAVCLFVSLALAYRITLVGEVNDNQQLVADNEIYDIDSNAVGDDLVINYIAQKVKVVGVLRDTRENKIIQVESFEVVEE